MLSIAQYSEVNCHFKINLLHVIHMCSGFGIVSAIIYKLTSVSPLLPPPPAAWRCSLSEQLTYVIVVHKEGAMYTYMCVYVWGSGCV